MPRPSRKTERRAVILEAYGRCVARHGVEGATLEKTAEEAGLARALIRHNVGNKDDLLDAFVEVFLRDATLSADELFDELPAENRVETLIEWLFDPQYSSAQEVSVTNALITAGFERRGLAKRLRNWTADFTARIESELRDAYPHATPDRSDAVATGLAAIYFNVDTFTPLGDVAKLRQSSETAASLLVSTLE